MNIHDKVKVRGTEETGIIIGIETRREHSANRILFLTVELDNGNIMVYDVSEVKLV